MASTAGLTGHHNNAATVHALLKHFNRSLHTTTYHPNWNISLTNSSNLTSTSDNKYYPEWLLILIAIFGSVTSVLTVLGNILVMLAFFLDRQIRQPTNYFILSLSVSDFLIGLLSMPLLTIYIYAKDWPLTAIICDIWLSLDYTVCLTSIYTVLFITIDRFCSVKMPAKYRKWRTKSKINIMILITWAVPTLIFFATTILYPYIKNAQNLREGVCDVHWNKNPVFNLCLTIAYFWTTLLVMIILYIFIYGVASNLEKKSQENARKMSSLVGMAGNAMTQLGAGIGVKKSPSKRSPNKRNHKIDSTKPINNDIQQKIQQKRILKQMSSNSSEIRQTNEGCEEENSNSFESHSDLDLSNVSDKKCRLSKEKNTQKNRHGLSVNWGTSKSTIAVNLVSTKKPYSNEQVNQKISSNVRSFANSLSRSPIRLGGLSATIKTKGKQILNSTQPSATLTPIPSESELLPNRMHPPPEPRPESLAIMSEELFNEKLKARQSPLLPIVEPSRQSPLITNNHSSPNSSSTSSIFFDANLTDDVSHSNQTLTEEKQEENLIEINSLPSSLEADLEVQPTVVNHINESFDESWRLLNSNSSLDIPYIDETDFEDLGYILHRRCVPPNDSNEVMHEETIVYKSPLSSRHKYLSNSSTVDFNVNHNTHDNSIDENHQTIFQCPIFDSVDLIKYVCTNSNPSSEKLPLRHYSLCHVRREPLRNKEPETISLPLSSNDIHTRSSLNFVPKEQSPLYQTPSHLPSSSPDRHTNMDDALIDFSQCGEINDIDDNLTNSESDILSNYKEINQETPSLLRLNEQFSSAFTDDEYHFQCDNNFMKMMILNKTSIDTTSDEQTVTNSISLNTYSQDYSVDKIFQDLNITEQLSPSSWISSSSSSSSSSQDRQLPRHFLAAIEKKRNTSSDSDAITTTTTTLTTSTIYGCTDKRNVSDEMRTSEFGSISKKHHSDTYLHDSDVSSLNNRNASKVTFESFVTQNSSSSSPKMKDQSVMVQIDIKEELDYSNNNHQPVRNGSESKKTQTFFVNEGTGTTSANSTKSSVRDFLYSQKSTTRRKSKTQNRARKALRTITFILGAFVICWTPWHIYSAVQSLCESCKNNWVFANPVFHCVYFFCYLNSPINPFCYALANQQFKKTFTRILRLDLRRL